MTLFGTHRAAQGTIEEVGHMIEHYFKSRRLDPKTQEISGTQGGWWVIEGSARVYIFVQDTTGGPVIRITSPIVTVPEKGDISLFYRHLLDINSTLTSCALATNDNAVLVVSQRSTAQLDQEELDSMIWNVAYVADLLDDKLVKEYGARRYQS
jgi:hypothetical protein